jgi:pimeloyl-ACP methyl ester carboxylesterase
MRKIFLLLVIVLLAMFSYSQKLPTNYLNGKIEVPNSSIEIFLVISDNGTGIEANLYIPEQFVYASKASETKRVGDTIILKFKSFSSELSGVVNFETKEMIGNWKQGGQLFPITLDFIDKEAMSFIERPQEPQPPYSYIQKEYVIENKKGNASLCGTLTIPDTTNVYPLVILITGSGAQNRNEEIAGHKPFLIIADYLTKNGIAVFRYDDRGVGKSTGNIAVSTTEDFMYDAISVVKYFEQNPNINPKKIGVIGHSEGGVIAMMLAAKYPKDIAFIISMAGPGKSSKDLLLKQLEEINRASGFDEETIKILSEMQQKGMEIPAKAKDMTDMRKKITELYDFYGAKFSDEDREKYMLNNQGINMAVMQFSSPWMKYFLQMDPVVYLKKIKCPVLALNGSNDIQVDADQNLDAIQKNLNPKKCKQIEIKKLDGLNHLFQNADKGTVEEYFRINESISMEAVEIMKDFILKQ